MNHRRALAAAFTLAVALVAASCFPPLPPTGPGPTRDPSLPTVAFAELGRYSTGVTAGGETTAEVVAYDRGHMFVTNVDGIDVVDLADPAAPRKVASLVLPGDPTSVAVHRGLVAVSVPAGNRQDPGSVLFFLGTRLVGEVVVGSLPDMVTFTPDGRRLLVANEGEPNSYGQPDSVDPEGSVSVVETLAFRLGGGRLASKLFPPRVHTVGFGEFDLGGPRHGELPAEVRITGPGASVAQDLEPEYVTVAEDGRTAWVSLQENNALAVVDLARLRVERIVALGTSDHGREGWGIDASDRDGRIDIAPRPVKGLYMPDGIANVRLGRETFVLTANEGDAREYPGHTDVGRARSVADTSAVPDAASDAALGRLNVITSDPAPRNASGKVTELYSLGSRSFSIWDEAGELVWDSGDDFERITARTHPGNFNASNSNNDFDNRSDDKGPEPESVVVGRIGTRSYAFVALERIGGVMVYDISDPRAPVFQQYLTTRQFPARSGGDVGPDSGAEGLVFVPAKDGPGGRALLLVGNEVTGTVNVFAAAPPDGAGTLTLLHNNDGESTIEPLANGDLGVAGVAAYKTVLDREIRDARNRGNAVMNVYAGDAFLASSTLSCSLPPNDAPPWDAVAQRQMAYDAHVFGNHEFDFGPDFLERFVRTFDRGGTPTQPFLSASLDFSGEPTWSDLLDGDGVLSVEAADGRVVARAADLVDEVTGMRVGIVGATTPALPTISSPRNVALRATDIADTAVVVQSEVDRLTRRGVNKIVLVSHLQDIANDTELVSRLRDVDVAVAGGGDELLANPGTPLLPNPPAVSGPYPLSVSAADGATVPVVTTEGNYKYAGRIDLRFDADGELVGIDETTSFPRRVVVAGPAATAAGITDAVAPDPGVQATAVAPVTACLAGLAEPVARTEVPINVSQGSPALGFTNGVRTGETNGGNLVTDGYLRAYDTYGPAAGLPPRGGATKVVAVQNGGGIRQNAGNVLPVGATFDGTAYSGVPGPISRRNTLDVMAFLSNAVTVVRDVDPDSLRTVLERSAASLPGSGGQFLQVAGMSVTYRLSGTPHAVSPAPPGGNFGDVVTVGTRVWEVTLDDGTPIVVDGEVVPGAPPVSVVTNSFTAAGGDNYATLGGVPAAARVNLGLTYEQALLEQLLSFPSAEGLPTVPASDVRYADPDGEGRIRIEP